jgi:hypothetical protein
MEYEGASQLCEAPFFMQTMDVFYTIKLVFFIGTWDTASL